MKLEMITISLMDNDVVSSNYMSQIPSNQTNHIGTKYFLQILILQAPYKLLHSIESCR